MGPAPSVTEFVIVPSSSQEILLLLQLPASPITLPPGIYNNYCILKIYIYYSMGGNVIWRDISRVGVSYFHKLKASENIAHKWNI